jgi:hypothetical protein
MFRLIAGLCALLVVVAAPESFAQAKPGAAKSAPAAAAKPAPAAPGGQSTPLYLYLSDSACNRVLLQTEFTLSNQEHDVRVLRRLHGVLGGLEQKGFKRNDRATISDWDKKEKFAKCYVYLEDAGSGKGKDTGARVWCSETGISEVAVAPSEDPKHVDKVLERFSFFLAKAKDGLKN